MTDNCWLWALTLTKTGYGILHRDDVSYLAHRLSYETFMGKIPSGLELDHLCGVKHCINPDHLELVTHQENIRRANIKRNAKGQFSKSGSKD